MAGEKYIFRAWRLFLDDYDYAIENSKIPSDYKVWWGYEDEKLFEFAKEKCTELSRQEEPFNLTMLTVDTHFEDGYMCEKCPNDYGDQYANVMACSSKQVYEFIEWVKQQPFMIIRQSYYRGIT